MSPIPSPVSYPSVTVGGKPYQLRYTRSSQFMLEAWGFELSPSVKIPALAWAAAMVGHVDPSGQFHSAGFKTPLEFTDTIGLEEDLTVLYEAVTEALKKAAPKATITLDASPANPSGDGPRPS